MKWIREMEHDAVAVAIPDWEWQDTDIVTIITDWEEAGQYSEYTVWDAKFTVVVGVKTYDGRREASCYLVNDDVPDFWMALMKKGSGR